MADAPMVTVRSWG